jgi:hypothetical protein
MGDIDIHSEAEPSKPTWLIILTIVAMWSIVLGFMLLHARQSKPTLRLKWQYQS